MAGCYGASGEDRYYERMLNNYLDKEESEDIRECARCGNEYTWYEDNPEGNGRNFCSDCLAEIEPQEEIND